MPSIFDNIFGGPVNGIAGPTTAPSILNPFDPAAMRRAQLQDSLAGFSSALLAAGGPSATPVDFGSALGKGLGGALQGQQTGEDKYLKRALVGSQVQKAQADIARQKAQTDLFAPPKQGEPGYVATTMPATAGSGPLATPAAAAIPAPGAGPSNPTNPGNLANGQGGFQAFKTPEEGVAAAVKLAQEFPQRYNNGQPMTLAQIEAHWAPPDDGKDPMTKGNVPGVWSSNVARAMNIDPNTPVDFSNPATGESFAKAVHVAEHPPGSAYAPDVYQRGTQMAYGGAAGPATAGGSLVTQGAPNPVQLAQAPGQEGAPVQTASPAPKTLRQIVLGLPAGMREAIGTLPPNQVVPALLKQMEPNLQPAYDNLTHSFVFADVKGNHETMPNGQPRFVPKDVMTFPLEQQNADSQARQATAREEANAIRSRNEPVMGGPGGVPVPNPVLPAAKGAIVAAEENAKLDPEIRKYQAQLAMKDHEASQSAATLARSSNANLDRLQSLLEKVNTGKGTETINNLKAVAKAAGFDLASMGIADDVGVVQAAKALTSKMTLELGSAPDGGLKGSFSDKDVAFLKSGIAGLDTTPEGRKLIVDFQKRVNQRAIDVANIKNDYVRSGEFANDPAGMWKKVKEYADAHPLFDPAKDGPQATAPAPGNGGVTLDAIDAEIARRKKPGAPTR